MERLIAAFEVEPGRPFADDPLATVIVSRLRAAPWGSAGVGEPGRTVNSVAKPERVRIPSPPL